MKVYRAEEEGNDMYWQGTQFRARKSDAYQDVRYHGKQGGELTVVEYDVFELLADMQEEIRALRMAKSTEKERG